MTVSALWEHCRDIDEIATFERFVQGLDLLYCLGTINFERGLLVRSE